MHASLFEATTLVRGELGMDHTGASISLSFRLHSFVLSLPSAHDRRPSSSRVSSISIDRPGKGQRRRRRPYVLRIRTEVNDRDVKRSGVTAYAAYGRGRKGKEGSGIRRWKWKPAGCGFCTARIRRGSASSLPPPSLLSYVSQVLDRVPGIRYAFVESYAAGGLGEEGKGWGGNEEGNEHWTGAEYLDLTHFAEQREGLFLGVVLSVGHFNRRFSRANVAPEKADVHSEFNEQGDPAGSTCSLSTRHHVKCQAYQTYRTRRPGEGQKALLTSVGGIFVFLSLTLLVLGGGFTIRLNPNIDVNLPKLSAFCHDITLYPNIRPPALSRLFLLPSALAIPHTGTWATQCPYNGAACSTATRTRTTTGLNPSPTVPSVTGTSTATPTTITTTISGTSTVITAIPTVTTVSGSIPVTVIPVPTTSTSVATDTSLITSTTTSFTSPSVSLSTTTSVTTSTSLTTSVASTTTATSPAASSPASTGNAALSNYANVGTTFGLLSGALAFLLA
ncbi:hypothetical protein NMY22_g4945 [Coprinellus aureogranulatus]|nr:hypothetical protein NMY22_g4945 [Coprinellus aureogranulatus]